MMAGGWRYLCYLEGGLCGDSLFSSLRELLSEKANKRWTFIGWNATIESSIRPQMKMGAAVFPGTEIADRLSDW